MTLSVGAAGETVIYTLEVRIRRASAAFVIFAWVLTPDVLCLFPGIQLTVTEAECCRRMAGDCSNMPMPESHSCCKTIQRPDTAALSKTPGIHPPGAAPAPAYAEFEIVVPESFEAAATAGSNHSPPGPLYTSITILRI